MATKSKKTGAENGKVVIKKYANRRLYNTETSSYVTLDYLSQMVKEERDFQVVDAKTGQDLTRTVLTQIIVEEEAKGETLLPLPFLRQLIAFYGGGMDTLVPKFLEQSMEAFASQQDKWRQMVTGGISSGITPGAFPGFEEMTRNNMAMFENAAKMWTGGTGTPDAASNPAAGDAAQAPRDQELDMMRRQMAMMQDQLNKLADK